jgi:hypothetical protein
VGRRPPGQGFNHADPGTGLRIARDLARQLETRWPDAAASLREGLEEMFTVRRLGIGDRLARTLTSTNPIESMISVGRSTTDNVKEPVMAEPHTPTSLTDTEVAIHTVPLRGEAKVLIFVEANAHVTHVIGARCVQYGMPGCGPWSGLPPLQSPGEAAAASPLSLRSAAAHQVPWPFSRPTAR